MSGFTLATLAMLLEFMPPMTHTFIPISFACDMVWALQSGAFGFVGLLNIAPKAT